MSQLNAKKKIRRIDNQNDIRSHCKKFNSKPHKAKKSEIEQPIHEFAGFMRSDRTSIEMKILNEKISSRQERKGKKQSISSNEDSMKILAVYVKLKFFFNKLSGMYKTNENKLTALLIRHIRVEYYIFSKDIMGIVKNFRLGKQNESIFYHPQANKLIHELNKFRQFLEAFYERKCLKQIEIIQSSIIQREQSIRYKTPLDRYQKITKSFRPSLITNNIDISEEFRQMSSTNGSFTELSKVQSSLFRKLRETQSKISRVYQSVCSSKENIIFC